MSASRLLGFATDSRRFAVWMAAALLMLSAILGWRFKWSSLDPLEIVFEPPSRLVEPGSMCPWREPDEDVRLFFPGATGYQTETRVLSGRRMELKERLGRALEADENSLYVHRVTTRDGGSPGVVLTRRVKGEHGVIELVLAIDRQRRVCGLILQRMREPPAVAEALQDRAWLNAFVGKGVESRWIPGQDFPSVPEEARASAESIVQGARSMVILFDTSEVNR